MKRRRRRNNDLDLEPLNAHDLQVAILKEAMMVPWFFVTKQILVPVLTPGGADNTWQQVLNNQH